MCLRILYGTYTCFSSRSVIGLVLIEGEKGSSIYTDFLKFNSAVETDIEKIIRPKKEKILFLF